LHKAFVPLFKPDTPEDYKRSIKESLAGRLGYVAGRLEGRNYLLGDRFTVADGYLFTVLGWGHAVEIDIGQWPPLLAFLERVGQRPSVRDALAAES